MLGPYLSCRQSAELLVGLINRTSKTCQLIKNNGTEIFEKNSHQKVNSFFNSTKIVKLRNKQIQIFFKNVLFWVIFFVVRSKLLNGITQYS